MIWRVEWTVSSLIDAGSEEAAFEIAAEMDPRQADSMSLFSLTLVEEEGEA